MAGSALFTSVFVFAPAAHAADSIPAGKATGISWDQETLVLVHENGGYGRMIRMQDRSILCSATVGDGINVKRSQDDGKTWSAPTRVSGPLHGPVTNAEMLQLSTGRILLSFNERPHNNIQPYTIQLCMSDDNGATWSSPKKLYEGGAEFENGCWEPAHIQLPSGEIQLYFANESPYRQSTEQEISMMRSRDNGEHWSKPERVIFREGHRDGMPVPLLLRDGKTIVVAIEDNAYPYFGIPFFRPAIVRMPVEDNWQTGTVTPASSYRALAFPQPGYSLVRVGGAPYIAQLPRGETILSFQSPAHSLKYQTMVYIGDKNAQNFEHPTVPFTLSKGTSALWNSIFIKDDDIVTAISETTINGKSGIWAIDGHIIRRII